MILDLRNGHLSMPILTVGLMQTHFLNPRYPGVLIDLVVNSCCPAFQVPAG